MNEKSYQNQGTKNLSKLVDRYLLKENNLPKSVCICEEAMESAEETFREVQKIAEDLKTEYQKMRFQKPKKSNELN